MLHRKLPPGWELRTTNVGVGGAVCAARGQARARSRIAKDPMETPLGGKTWHRLI
jgi:hypothetical protein